MDEFLPVLEFPGSLLAKVWNIAAGPDRREFAFVDTLSEPLEHRTRVVAKDLSSEPTEGVHQLFFKSQQTVQEFAGQSAKDLQISCDEMQSLCEGLKDSVSRHRRAPVNSPHEGRELAKYVTARAGRKQHDNLKDALGIEDSDESVGPTVREKVLEPEIPDFVGVGYAFAADLVTHKLLCKALAIVPDITVILRPVKGFAVVTTPMSINLLDKERKEGEKQEFQTGFLTLDQERRVVPLHGSDPQVGVYTLVGIWVTGLPVPSADSAASSRQETESTECKAMDKRYKIRKMAEREDRKARVLRDPNVMAAILRFLFSGEIKSRMSPRPKRGQQEVQRYLLINFVGGSALPQFLEFEIKASDKEFNNSWLMLESAYDIAREPRSTFRPIRLKLSYSHESPSSSDYSCVYKLAYVLSSLNEDERGHNSRKQTKENADPNRSRRNPSTALKTHCHLAMPQRFVKSNIKSNPRAPSLVLSQLKAGREKEPEVPLEAPAEEGEEIKRSLTFVTKRQEENTRGYEDEMYANPSTGSNAPGDESSFDCCIDSTCMQGGQPRPRLSAPRGGQFPCYSGDVSLLHTPEYSASAVQNDDLPMMQMIIMENQKTIQAIQQQLLLIAEEMKATQTSQPPCVPPVPAAAPASTQQNVSSYISIEERPAQGLNMSSEGTTRAKQKLSMSQSEQSYTRSIPVADNNSSTNNSLSNLNKLITLDKDSGSELQHQFSHEAHAAESSQSRGGQKGLSFTLDASKIEAKRDFTAEPEVRVQLPLRQGTESEPAGSMGARTVQTMVLKEPSIEMPRIIDPVDLTVSSSNASSCHVANFNLSDHTLVSQTQPQPSTQVQSVAPAGNQTVKAKGTTASAVNEREK